MTPSKLRELMPDVETLLDMIHKDVPPIAAQAIHALLTSRVEEVIRTNSQFSPGECLICGTKDGLLRRFDGANIDCPGDIHRRFDPHPTPDEFTAAINSVWEGDVPEWAMSHAFDADGIGVWWDKDAIKLVSDGTFANFWGQYEDCSFQESSHTLPEHLRHRWKESLTVRPS